MPKVGDGFWVFSHEYIGSGYVLERRWVSEVRYDGFQHIGGAIGSFHSGSGWPQDGDTDPAVALRKGKKRVLAGIAAEKKKLLARVAELTKQSKQVRSLKLENLRRRGGNDTYEQFKRGWDSDF